jgi:hypothetical protein
VVRMNVSEKRIFKNEVNWRAAAHSQWGRGRERVDRNTKVDSSLECGVSASDACRPIDLELQPRIRG